MIESVNQNNVTLDQGIIRRMPLSTRLRQDYHHRLKKISFDTNTPMVYLIEEAIKDFLEKVEK